MISRTLFIPPRLQSSKTIPHGAPSRSIHLFLLLGKKGKKAVGISDTKPRGPHTSRSQPAVYIQLAETSQTALSLCTDSYATILRPV